jgi:hypothetical protein
MLPFDTEQTSNAYEPMNWCQPQKTLLLAAADRVSVNPKEGF